MPVIRPSISEVNFTPSSSAAASGSVTIPGVAVSPQMLVALPGVGDGVAEGVALAELVAVALAVGVAVNVGVAVGPVGVSVGVRVGPFGVAVAVAVTVRVPGAEEVAGGGAAAEKPTATQ